MKRLAALAACELSLYLKERDDFGLIREYRGLLSETLTREEFRTEKEACIESFREEPGPKGEVFRRLFCILGEEGAAAELAWLCLELAVLYYMDSWTGGIFEGIQKGAGSGATLSLAAALLWGEGAVCGHFAQIKEAYGRVELLLLAPYPAKNIAKAPLLADDRLMDWLNGGDDVALLHPRFLKKKEPVKQKMAVWEEKALTACEKLNAAAGMEEEEGVPYFYISGEEGSGRKYLMEQIAARNGLRLLWADFALLCDLPGILSPLRRLLRELLFDGVCLCITDVPAWPNIRSYLEIIASEYETAAGFAFERGLGMRPCARPLCMTVQVGVKAAPFIDGLVISSAIGKLSIQESIKLWDFFSERYLGGPMPCGGELAAKMRLSAGRIQKIVRRIACSGEEGGRGSIFRYCYELLDDGRYDSIKRVETRYTYEDLKLEESQKSIIRDICAQVNFRKQVMDDWNIRSRYSYGACVSALFTGPPGTGKTMAAHVMAGILGLELFKVDLSQLVDKYIGETEKRLEDVFRRAEQSNMILFFDEADSVIGKRSEVKEAKDRYANTEVSYLLQRIEEFDGIVVLSTNYSQNIDAAFMRRIRFTVHFPLPDERTRKEIWQSALPDETPREELDFDYLSRQFEFSGGQIKNVVLNAAFFAASDGGAVGMRHMVKAIRLELTKDKKVSFQEALGEYAHLAY